MFILKKGHQPGVYVPLRALFLVIHVNVPGTVSGHLRSSSPHVRSIRKDDMMRQRHLRDRFLRVQVRST